MGVKRSGLCRSDMNMLQRTRGRGQIQITEDVKMEWGWVKGKVCVCVCVWDKGSWGVSMGAREQSAILRWKESSHLLNDKHVSGSPSPPPSLLYLSEHGFTVTDTITRKHLVHHFGNSRGNVPRKCQVTRAVQQSSQRAKYHSSFYRLVFFSPPIPVHGCIASFAAEPYTWGANKTVLMVEQVCQFSLTRTKSNVLNNFSAAALAGDSPFC